MRTPHLTRCYFMIHSTIKSTLKFFFSNTQNQLQDPTPQLFFYQSLRHHPSPYFLNPLPSKFSHRIIHQLLIIHFFIDDLLLSKFAQARHTGGNIFLKMVRDIIELLWVYLNCFIKHSLSFKIVRNKKKMPLTWCALQYHISPAS